MTITYHDHDDTKPDVYERDYEARCTAHADLAALTRLQRENEALKADNYRLQQRVMTLLGRIEALAGE